MHLGGQKWYEYITLQEDICLDFYKDIAVVLIFTDIIAVDIVLIDIISLFLLQLLFYFEQCLTIGVHMIKNK